MGRRESLLERLSLIWIRERQIWNSYLFCGLLGAMSSEKGRRVSLTKAQVQVGGGQSFLICCSP